MLSGRLLVVCFLVSVGVFSFPADRSDDDGNVQPPSPLTDDDFQDLIIGHLEHMMTDKFSQTEPLLSMLSQNLTQLFQFLQALQPNGNNNNNPLMPQNFLSIFGMLQQFQSGQLLGFLNQFQQMLPAGVNQLQLMGDIYSLTNILQSPQKAAAFGKDFEALIGKYVTDPQARENLLNFINQLQTNSNLTTFKFDTVLPKEFYDDLHVLVSKYTN